MFVILFAVFSELWRGDPKSKCYLQKDAENWGFCYHQFLPVPTSAILILTQALCTSNLCK